jgi:hypothetical protein
MFKPLQYITLSLEENLLYLGSSLTNFLISFQELVNVTSPVSSSSSLEHNQGNICTSEEPLKTHNMHFPLVQMKVPEIIFNKCVKSTFDKKWTVITQRRVTNRYEKESLSYLNIQFLSTSAKLLKATVSWVVSVRKEQLGSQRTNFHEIF